MCGNERGGAERSSFLNPLLPPPLLSLALPHDYHDAPIHARPLEALLHLLRRFLLNVIPFPSRPFDS
jgi:hypothetical protein